MSVSAEFYLWIDQVNMNGVIQFPQAKAAREIAAASLQAGIHHGRITLWLWKANRKKMAFAMARRGGEGSEKPVVTMRAAPPFNDGDKAQIVFDQERK